MHQTSINITPKYCQEMHYNYMENSVFLLQIVLRFCAIAKLTAQIPAETL